jgi:hypothetical protein
MTPPSVSYETQSANASQAAAKHAQTAATMIKDAGTDTP